MLSRILAVIVTVLGLFTLGGCAAPKSLPDVPADLAGQGLLVARLYVLGMKSMDNASISIDGRLMPSSLRDGYIVAALDPGEHKLSQIRAEGQLLGRNTIEASPSPMRQVRGGGAPVYIYVPGASYTIHYTTLSVDRTFRIEPGKVTNLGLIVYLPVVSDPDTKRATSNNSREFRVVTLDNGPDIGNFLEINYPDLARSLKDRQMVLAPGNYFDLKNLPALRRAIALHESRGSNLINSPTRTVVYGRAGTVVAFVKKPGVVAPVVEVLDTGTLADIVGAARSGEQFTFVASDASVLNWDGSKLTRTSLPNRIHPVRMSSLGDSGLLVIDNHMRVLTARSSAHPWITHEGLMTKTARNDINVAADSQGSYLSVGDRGLPDAVYYLKAGDSVPVPMGVPDNKAGISKADRHVLVAREAGLFMMFDKPSYYFWSKASQSWSLYSQPPGKCKPMRIDSEGDGLTIECDGIDYQSSDRGASWKKSLI